MEKWIKYINSLNKNDRRRILAISEKIFMNNFDGLDIKSIKGRKYLFRCRIGKYRILFTNRNGKIHIVSCDVRGDIYKNLGNK